MNFNYVFLITILITLYASAIIGREEYHDDTDHHESGSSDHHESRSSDHEDELHHDDNLHHDDEDIEPREFDHDPHEDDSDYDEDMITGTSHHNKRTKEETKLELEQIFIKADKNNDSKIDGNELKLFIIGNMKKLHNETTEEQFTKLDTNNDRKLSLDEYFLHHHDKTAAELDNITNVDKSAKTDHLIKRVQMEKQRFKASDNNGDGTLNSQEYLLMKYPIFFPHMAHTVVHDYIADLDVNKDGMVDKLEYTNHFHKSSDNKSLEEEILKKNQADFDHYDKDKNGKIDPEEYFAILKPGYEEPAKAEVEHLFKESDSDHDGVLSWSEIEKHSHLWLGGEPIDEDDEYSHHYEDEL